MFLLLGAGDRSGRRWRIYRVRVFVRLVLLVVGVLVSLVLPVATSAHRSGGLPVALVTAETANEVLAVSLPDGRVLRRVRVRDPQAIAADASGPAVVVSPLGTVTLLAWRSLRPLKVFRAFRSPQIAAITPDGKLAYVTDAATGRLAVIDLLRRRIVDSVFVGIGAHHLAISPDGRRTWVALTETASTVVILDTSRERSPRVIGRFHPPVAAHDLAFSPSGKRVWLTSASAAFVSVVSSRTRKVVARVAAGRGPQHVVFIPYGKPRALISSGYGSTLEEVAVRSRRVLHRVGVPYGSFNLATSGDVVAASSLMRGVVTEFNGQTLSRRLTRKVARETRDLAISVWP